MIISCSKAPQDPPAARALPTPSESHRLAPPGVLYAIEYASLATSSGVVALVPGARVRLIEDKGDTIVVSDGAAKFEVAADKLTNDLDIAALAARRDAQGQQDFATYLAEQRAIDIRERARQNEAYDGDQREIAAQRATAAAASQYSNPLERGPYHERGSLSRRRWIYNPEYPESRSPGSNVIITQPP